MIHTRQLTQKQKKLLKRWYSKDNTLSTYEDLSNAQWEQLQAINDTEILWATVSEYLYELSMQVVYS